jgi:hypothetical protein
MNQITISVGLVSPIYKDELRSLTESLSVFFASRTRGIKFITTRIEDGQPCDDVPTLSQNPL